MDLLNLSNVTVKTFRMLQKILYKTMFLKMLFFWTFIKESWKKMYLSFHKNIKY